MIVRMLLLFMLVAPAFGHAEGRRRVAVSAGVGSRHFENSDTELVMPVQVRIDINPVLTVQVGEDIICSHLACALLGFYRAGMLFRPIEERISPYAYGYGAVFIHGAHPLDNQPRVYDVGLHWGAGVGVELELADRVGVYVEGGLLGDTGREFVAPTVTGGVLFRLDRPLLRSQR